MGSPLPPPDPSVRPLPAERAAVATDILCETFHDYPVMRYVLEDHRDYDHALRLFVGFSVSARVWRGEPMLALHEGDAIEGVAIMTPPAPTRREPPQGFWDEREATWKELGTLADERYRALGAIWGRIGYDHPNLHLNMIGVRRHRAGRGLGRLLLNEVHRLSSEDPASTGVTLTTEDPGNVPLYQHCGYAVVGEEHVADGVHTWSFFRSDQNVA